MTRHSGRCMQDSLAHERQPHPSCSPLQMSHTTLLGRMWRRIEQEHIAQRPSCRRCFQSALTPQQQSKSKGIVTLKQQFPADASTSNCMYYMGHAKLLTQGDIPDLAPSA